MKWFFKILYPVDASLSMPLPTVKRCANCVYKKSCNKKKEKNDHGLLLFNDVVSTKCKDFETFHPVVVNDGIEMANFKARAMAVVAPF